MTLDPIKLHTCDITSDGDVLIFDDIELSHDNLVEIFAKANQIPEHLQSALQMLREVYAVSYARKLAVQ